MTGARLGLVWSTPVTVRELNLICELPNPPKLGRVPPPWGAAPPPVLPWELLMRTFGTVPVMWFTLSVR